MMFSGSFSVRQWLVPLALVITLHVSAAEPFRAARSVHLSYPAADASIFYNEMVVEQSVDGSYFMACGWNTGYFGIQQLHGETNRVVIFSVWDPSKGDDPKTLKSEDRVEVLYEGAGVRIKRFGGEGTGGQCMAPLLWRVGETNRFAIQAAVEGDKTSYTAFVLNGETEGWRKLATFRTRTHGQWLKGLYSFVEDFRRDTRSVDETRRAAFGPGWIRTGARSSWTLLTRARFTASNADWESKENIDAGTAEGRFYLMTGGTVRRSRELRSEINLPAENASRGAMPFLEKLDAAAR